METTDGGADDVREVLVGYEAAGVGPALVVEQAGGRGDGPVDGEVPGLLRAGGAVVTLEIPRPDGGRSVLSWDPAEVALDPLVA